MNVTTVYDWTDTGNLASILDPNGNKTLFDYNAAGQVTSEANPLGKSWNYAYDTLGRLASQVNGNGQTTNYAYTSRSDLAQVSYPGSNVTFEYDANQQPVAMTDPHGVTGWKYDANGLMTEQIDANGSRLGYAYDAAQQLTTLTMPTGESIGYEYDDAGRPVAQTSPWGNIAYEWDPAGNLTNMLRSTGVATEYSYDAANRYTQIKHIAPASPSDPNAAPASTVAPEPVAVKPVTTEVDQCVDAAGYIENRAIPAAGATSHECVKTGDYLDRRTVPALPNPVENVDTITFDYTYDPAGNVSNATRTLGSLDDPALPGEGTTPNAGTAPSVAAPDPTPTFPSVLETPDVDSRDYTYDSLNRLTGSETSKGNTAKYAYDPAGNRVQASTTTDAGTTDVMASFNEANQLTGSTTNGASSSYGYDGNGNRTTQNENGVTTDFTYQTDNRLTGVSRDGRSSSYAYDGLGRQLNTTETSGLGSQTTKSVWDGTSVVQQSNPASGTSTLMRDAFGDVALQAGNGDPSWTLLDRLGTTAAQAVGGSVAQLSTFGDWGNQSFDTIGWNSAVSYTGEITDAGYGLNNYYSRSYDPTSGSWMSQDSWRGLLTEPQSLSRYAYVNNSPATLVDALGNKPYDPPMQVAGKNADGWVYVEPPVSTGTVISIGGDDPRKAAGMCGGSASYNQNPCEDDELVTVTHKSGGINCETDMKVGMDPVQVAINEACGKAFSEEQMKNAEPWQRDLWDLSQRIDKAIEPWVPLILIIAGVAAGGKGGPTASKPPATGTVKPPVSSAGSPAVQEAIDGIASNRWPPPGNPGMKGGGAYQNRDGALPTNSSGVPITYREWDVNPKTSTGRDSHRIVTGSDGSYWYTDDHYETFTRIK